MVRVAIEQRDEGESISFFSRPLTAAPAPAARRHEKPRRPNKKRVEKRMMWRISCEARQAADINGQQQPALQDRRKGSGSRTSPAASSQGECQQVPDLKPCMLLTVTTASRTSSQPTQLDQPHQTAALMQRRWQEQRQLRQWFPSGSHHQLQRRQEGQGRPKPPLYRPQLSLRARPVSSRSSHRN